MILLKCADSTAFQEAGITPGKAKRRCHPRIRN
jgi:hypothetical protein